MATLAEIKKTYDEWREHCKRIQSFTDTTMLAKESDVEKDRRKKRLLKNYAAFCEYYFPHFLSLRDKTTGEVVRVIHNAPFHNDAARLIKGTPNLKAVFKWPRGHAKSTHMDIFVPLWLMFQPKPLIRFMVVVGKSEDAAVRLLSDIQAELEFNQRILSDFGNQKSIGDWTEGEFTTEGGIHFLAWGRGQSPRGLRNRDSRPDYIVIDDLDDDDESFLSRHIRGIVSVVLFVILAALLALYALSEPGQIAALDTKNLTALQTQFEELYGFIPGETNAKNLRQRLAWRLQEISLGGIPETDMAILRRIADEDPLSNLQTIRSVKLNTVRGTRYERVWKKRTYSVLALGDGRFEYDGKEYKSLSAIAKVITGSKWNGKAFFGVK